MERSYGSQGHEIDVEVLVCGGGMAGSVSAIAAGRQGASTLLVERWGFLGGSATAAAVGQFVGWETAAGRQVVLGIAEEIVQRLLERGSAFGHTHFVMSTGHRMDRVSYDPEALKLVLDEMVQEAGTRVLFHAMVAAVHTRERTIDEVALLTKSGPIKVRPRMVIDATGDLDVLARAGGTFLPLAEGEMLQPATMMFRFGPINYDRFEALTADEQEKFARRGVEQGALARAALHQSRIPGTDDGWFNITRVALDATDPFALSAAEIEARRQAFAAAAYLTAVVPGCEKGKLTALAPQLGIRETRRLRGLYVLSADDIRAGRRFEDTIAVGAYPMDIHPARGTGLSVETLGEDHWYEIPYRCLVPCEFENVLVAGRGISATHQAHAATRVMPTCMAIGHAAGTAAALIARSRGNAQDVEVDAIRDALRGSGAFLP